MAIKNVESIGYVQSVSLTDTIEYSSLIGFSASPNKILKIQGPAYLPLNIDRLYGRLNAKVQAQMKIAAVNWKDNTGLDKNSAGFALITNVTNFGSLLNSTLRGLICGIEILQSNANPNFYVQPFKMVSGVLTLGTKTTVAITTALTNNTAYKLFIEMNSQSLGYILKDLNDGIVQGPGFLAPNTNYNSLIGQNLPESGFYIGSQSGITDAVSEGGNRLMFIDELQYYIG